MDPEDAMPLTLRDRLRRDTTPDHAAAAQALQATGCLDEPDPRAFLRLQRQALLTRAPAARLDDPETALALRLHRRIRTALRQDLGTVTACGQETRASPVMPTGFAYVALGATVGIALLAPRWPNRGRFLDLMAELAADWAALSERLAGAPATGQRADHAVAGAQAIFAALIAASAAVALPGGRPPNG
jgi:heme oxygenase